jgi:hypothetical protein
LEVAELENKLSKFLVSLAIPAIADFAPSEQFSSQMTVVLQNHRSNVKWDNRFGGQEASGSFGILCIGTVLDFTPGREQNFALEDDEFLVLSWCCFICCYNEKITNYSFL